MKTKSAINLGSRASAYGALVLRIGLGAVMLAHAYAKAAVFTFSGAASFFEQHGFPGWTVYPVFLAELVGGAALVTGVATRWVAMGLLPVLSGALKPHVANGWMFTATGGGWEYVAFLLVALVAQVCLGDGAYALGPALRRIARPQAKAAMM